MGVVLLLQSGWASAADARLVFARASRIQSAWGGFPGVPGGGVLADDPSCALLSGIGGLSGNLKLEADPARHQRKLKRRVQAVFEGAFMKQVLDQVVEVRKLSYPGISDEDARTVIVLVNDCTFDSLGSGPAVLPMKSAKRTVKFQNKAVPWVLILSRASWAEVDEVFAERPLQFKVPELILAHELTHGMTADVLTPETIDRSNVEKTSSNGHDVDRVTDRSTAYWEGLSEGIEAIVGERLRGALAYPYAIDPGALGFLLERQLPVRTGKYYFDPATGLPRRPGQLLEAEGFVAAFTYRLLAHAPFRLADGTVIQGWPFVELARIMKAAQPATSDELIRAVTSRPRPEEAWGATREFLALSRFTTFAEGAFDRQLVLARTGQLLNEFANHLRLQPGDISAVEGYRAATARMIELRTEWTAAESAWWMEAQTRSADGALPSPLRLLEN